ncbi:hypothetical protein BDR03DRAFT_943029 [Suillus americanus]|nr:hypothetical protein BDR03DRAFT_943029 [Suillus americanus]
MTVMFFIVCGNYDQYKSLPQHNNVRGRISRSSIKKHQTTSWIFVCTNQRYR